MTAQIITGKFDKRYPVPVPTETLTREQKLAVQALAREWNTTVAGVLVIIVTTYLAARER